MAGEDDDFDEFRLLMRRVAEGSEDAARKIVERHEGHIRRAVRRVLSRRLRSQFDSLDFTQLAWRSFFRRRDDLERFNSPAELVKWLITVARNKVALEARHQHQSGEDGVNHEQDRGEDRWQEAEEIPAGGPAAIDLAIVRERLEQMICSLPPVSRRIIELRLQGRPHEQIARLVHITRGAVYRFLKRLSREQP